MKNARTLTALFAIVLLSLVATPTTATETVSPGAIDRMAQVNNACPTFSWGADDSAAAYELIAYLLPKDIAQQVEFTAESEVMYASVAGSATSWTPSVEQCFAPGGRYVWFVRSVTELSGDQVIEASEWSVGRYFTVPAAPSPEEMQRALDVIRRWEASSTGGSLTIPSGTGKGTGTGSGSAHHKSVPTASAAIRGEHPGMTGENYGIIGTASSPDGAGVAAAHLDGGADLVLDGSVDGESDTRIWEWGMDRASSTDETFTFRNTDAGRLHVAVAGNILGHTVDAQELRISGSTVIDNSGEWMGSGSMLPCPGCVASSDIADGEVDTADLANASVTSTKIATGAVGASAMHSNAVTSTALADDAVTGAKIANGTVASADLATSSVTSTKIADGAVAAVDLANSSVTGAKIAAGAIESTDIHGNAINGSHIVDGSVATADLANNSVTGAKIVDGTVDTNDLRPGAVTSAQIENGTVTTVDLAVGAVNSVTIVDNGILAADLADGSVGTSEIADGSVISNDLADGAVLTAKIGDFSITGLKIGPSAISGAHIADGAVSSTDIAASSIGGHHIHDGTITAADVDPGGGIYSTKQRLYERLDTEMLAPGFCISLNASCDDSNDLPLQGWCVPSPTSLMTVRGNDLANWDSSTQEAEFTCEFCFNGGSVPEPATAGIVCIQVDG